MNRAVAGIVAVLFLVAAVYSIDTYSGLPSPVHHVVSSENSPWQSSLHSSLNAFFMWRHDGLLTRIAAFLSNNPEKLSYYLSLVAFCSGVYLLLLLVASGGQTSAAISSFLLSLTIVVLYGRDSLVIQSLTWWPLLIVALVNFERAKSAHLLNAAVVVLSVFFLSKSANQLSLVLSFIAIWLAAIMAHKQKETSAEFKLLACLILLIPAAVLYRTPAPLFPSYPPLAHVVPDDGIPGQVTPLIGTALPLPIIDRHAVRSLFCMASFLLVVFSIPVLRRRYETGYHRPIAAFLSIITVVLLLDCCLPESLAQIAPLEVLPRVIPGMSYFPLAPVVFPVALTVFALTCYARGNSAYFALSLVAFWIVGFNHPTLRVSFFLEPGRLQGLNSDRVFASLEAKFKDGTLSKDAFNDALIKAISPSHYLLQKEGIEILTQRAFFESTNFTSCANLTAEIRTSHRDTERAHSMLCDGDLTTRWSPKSGVQKGDESVLVRFSGPLAISGVNMDPGKFKADFPRGIKISCAKECDPTLENIRYDSERTIPSFQGAVKYTPEGFPYYAGQNEVKIFFPGTECQCLLLSQIGQSKSFDWSISELSFLVK